MIRKEESGWHYRGACQESEDGAGRLAQADTLLTIISSLLGPCFLIIPDAEVSFKDMESQNVAFNRCDNFSQ